MRSHTLVSLMVQVLKNFHGKVFYFNFDRKTYQYRQELKSIAICWHYSVMPYLLRLDTVLYKTSSHRSTSQQIILSSSACKGLVESSQIQRLLTFHAVLLNQNIFKYPCVDDGLLLLVILNIGTGKRLLELAISLASQWNHIYLRRNFSHYLSILLAVG